MTKWALNIRPAVEQSPCRRVSHFEAQFSKFLKNTRKSKIAVSVPLCHLNDIRDPTLAVQKAKRPFKTCTGETTLNGIELYGQPPAGTPEPAKTIDSLDILLKTLEAANDDWSKDSTSDKIRNFLKNEEATEEAVDSNVTEEATESSEAWMKILNLRILTEGTADSTEEVVDSVEEANDSAEEVDDSVDYRMQLRKFLVVKKTPNHLLLPNLREHQLLLTGPYARPQEPHTEQLRFGKTFQELEDSWETHF